MINYIQQCAQQTNQLIPQSKTDHMSCSRNLVRFGFTSLLDTVYKKISLLSILVPCRNIEATKKNQDILFQIIFCCCFKIQTLYDESEDYFTYISVLHSLGNMELFPIHSDAFSLSVICESSQTVSCSSDCISLNNSRQCIILLAPPQGYHRTISSMAVIMDEISQVLDVQLQM